MVSWVGLTGGIGAKWRKASSREKGETIGRRRYSEKEKKTSLRKKEVIIY